MMTFPTFQDVLDAQARVYAHMQRSALLRHALLDSWIGCQAWVKHENHNPTGAFKVRGGFNLVAQLTDEERRLGVVAASTGNHGQSLALACRSAGVRCRIVVPARNNREKIAAIRALGAEVVEHGADFDEAREYVEAMAAREGCRYVHSANEPQLIAGVATYTLEIFDDLPDVDIIFVPIGGGSGACGCGLVRTALRSRAKIVGVQAVGANAFARSWHGPERVSLDRAATFAEGIATRTTYDLTFAILEQELDDVVALEESELRDALAAALRCTHNLAEGAGAASLAAARKYGVAQGQKVVCVMTGGNVDTQTLQEALD